MMRKSLLLILWLVTAAIGFAQVNLNYLQTDSLQHEFAKAKTDTTRVLLMANLAESYRWSNSDSAMYFAQKALELARQINFPRGEANALISISVVQRELGNLAKALDLATNALSIAQQHQFINEELSALIRVANVYSASRNYPKALLYLHQSAKKSKDVGNAISENISLWLIASAFEQINTLDSAQYYAEKAFMDINFDAGTAYAYNILGDIQIKLKRDSLALHYYWIGLKEAARSKDYRTEANLDISLANYYKKHNQLDSAIYYAKEGLSVAQLLSYKNRIISSSSLLADIYASSDPKEALKYYKIFNAAKDSLYGADKMQALQTLMMNEQEKQKEAEAATLAYQNRLRQYALLIGLLFFLIIGLLLYRNNRRKQKANELLNKQKREIEERRAEAEIEVALERVRSKAMSMQNSDALGELIGTVFTELTKLDLVLTRCIIWVFDPTTNAARWWMANVEEPLNPMNFFIKYHKHPAYLTFVNAWKNQNVKFVYDLKGQDKINWDKILFNETELKNLPDVVKNGMQAPERVLLSGSFNNFGGINVASLEPLSENHFDILIRFARVFDLTYTRFLDLQKAEAQARDAQIEAALERVRSKSMAMHKSSDLLDVIKTLGDQFQLLGFKIHSANFNTSYRQKDWNLWLYNPGIPMYPEQVHVPYLDHPFFNRTLERIANGSDFNAFVFTKEEKDSFLDHLYSNTIARNAPEERKRFTYAAKGFAWSAVYLKNTALTIANYDAEPYTEEQNAIIRRFGNAFEQTYTRFLDLQKAEAQAREAKIEAALERVRSRTMAMHRSEELPETAEVLYHQLKELGDNPERITIGLLNESTGVITWWATDQQGTQLNFKFEATIDEPTVMRKLYNAWKANNKSLIIDLTGKDLSDWVRYCREVIGVPIKEELLKNRRLQTAGFFSHGWVMITSPQLPAPETINILERFASVFNLTYRRFLDLQKAEAQAREAQIEAGLERVRARTMAMHSSDDVSAATATMFTELEKLGIENFRGGITNIFPNRTQDVWSVNNFAEGKVVKAVGAFNIDDHPFWQRMYKEWERKNDFIHYFLSGQEKEDYVKILNSTQGYLTKPIENFPDVHFQVYFFDEGGVWTNSLHAHTDEEQQIMKRFTSVFSLTFRRYQDLRKAEAQAREAKIEASLERVRSKTMAMHNSRDVSAATAVMFNELSTLGVEKMRCGIGILQHDSDLMEVWSAAATKDGHEIAGTGLVGVNGHVLWQQMYVDWEAKKESFLYYLEGEDKRAYYKALAHAYSYSAPYLTEEFPDHYCYVTYFEDGVIFTFNYSLYSDDQKQILKRFAAVFSLTYRRYKDLKKAEAQAREATIETALEKVRGKAMAMHNSSDLSATASMVFTELRKLGINPIRCGVGLLNKESRKAQLYSATSSVEGDSLSLVGWVILSEHPVLEKIYDSWLNNEEYYPELQGEQMRLYYEQLLKGLPVTTPSIEGGKKQYGHFLPFSVGCLYAWSEDPYNDAEIKILKRFATIIDLTFRRYMELQQSEANAREAVKQAALDRIRADIASMRTINDLDRITPLIWNELTILGIGFIRCGVFIMDDSHKLIHTFLSTPDGKAIAAFHLPYSTPGNIQKVIDNWHDGQKYIDHWDESDFTQFAEILVKQNALTSADAYLKTIPHGGFYLHFLPFLQGMLYVGNSTQLNDDEIKLIQSVADAFSTAYARYEDFNKLEAAKQQVEKTLVDLKQAQTQLVQSEKMASLGELTAGIAHEIQNPLNFVNNFSEVSSELMDEIKAELDKGDTAEAKAIVYDVKQNLEKITHHGKRADAIVKSMLQHSRKTSGKKDSVDINSLVDEYLRLSYHGFRAKDKSFNAILETHYDAEIKTANIIGQDIGRVLLNLFNNAFYAVNEKKKEEQNGFEPTIQVTTCKVNNIIEIKVKDNGKGIPEKVLEKIYQPFFTTKPTGEGTGLGLSLSYDIITKGHGGELKVETKDGEGSEFIIQLPLQVSP